MDTKPYGTVLIKAAKILDYLLENPGSHLQRIAEGTEMTASTTSKILDTLILIGYVKRDAKSKEFSLGNKFIRYANKSVEQLKLVETARPYLVELQDQIDETIHLGIFNDDEILYVEKLEPKNQTIFMSSKVGMARPLYSSAMGKAVLSEWSDEEVQAYLERTELIPFTENTITNSLKLIREIDEARKIKVAFDDEEMEREIYCAGASIMNEGKVAGAFSVSMPKYRLTDKKKAEIISAIIQTKKKIEQSL